MAGSEPHGMPAGSDFTQRNAERTAELRREDKKTTPSRSHSPALSAPRAPLLVSCGFSTQLPVFLCVSLRSSLQYLPTIRELLDGGL
jgi:hypothetical protein